MIDYIINTIKSDAALTALLGATATDSHIYPLSAPIRDNSIIYTLSPISTEDAVRVDRLEIHTISKNMSNLIAIDNRVRKLLLTIGDTPNGSLHHVTVNGGGCLEDTATGMYHLFTYYYITIRSN